MNNRKTEFKFFTIPQYRKEEKYLCSMHEKGWKLIKNTFPGFYHFEKCEPARVTYRLDYNQEGIRNKEEYVVMPSEKIWGRLLKKIFLNRFISQNMNMEDARKGIFMVLHV